jgi:hypothetical protein
MVDVVKQKPMNILRLYMIEVYIAKDGSEACLSKPAEGVLRAGRSCKRNKAGAGV